MTQDIGRKTVKGIKKKTKKRKTTNTLSAHDRSTAHVLIGSDDFKIPGMSVVP